MKPQNRGNILFLILLAVVLFAALSYAVTSSMRGGGKDAGSEKSAAQAAEMINYFAQVSTATQRMMMVQDVKDYQLNFFTNNVHTTGSYDNANCTENRCRVFHPDGGAVTPRNFPSFRHQNGSGSGVARVVLTSVAGAGTALPDLTMVYYGMRKDICTEVNRQMGLNEYMYASVGLANGSALYIDNPYPSGPLASSTVALNVPQNAGLAGTFCVCAGSTPATCDTADAFYPAIVHVILPR